MNKKLNFIAPVGKTGYGVVGFHLLKTLSERDFEIGLFTRSPKHERTSPEESQLIQFASANSVFFDYEAPCINLWHQHEMAMRVGRGKYIGWPIFELDTLTEREIHHLNYPDEIIVCSEWAKKICLANGINREIHVVPLGIDPYIFNTNLIDNKKNERTIFLNAGKWEIRKGHDILHDAFNLAFSPTDNVELWMIPFNPFLTRQDDLNWRNMYLDTPMGKADKIKIYPWQDNHKTVAKIMAAADCGVFPSRAEGWNLELLEMMSLGKPVIATNYSAHTEFCNEYNCMLIDIEETEPAYDGQWFFEQGNWASIGTKQIDQLMNYMRLTHDRCRRPGKFTNDTGIKTGKSLTWDNTADLVEKILDK